MSYQVGIVCYATLEQAENVYFSQVTPVIQNGELYQLTKTDQGWFFKGEQVHADLPACSPLQNFNDGALIGWSVFAIAASLWIVKLIMQRLR